MTPKHERLIDNCVFRQSLRLLVVLNKSLGFSHFTGNLRLPFPYCVKREQCWTQRSHAPTIWM
jgi:hypothetical protein